MARQANTIGNCIIAHTPKANQQERNKGRRATAPLHYQSTTAAAEQLWQLGFCNQSHPSFLSFLFSFPSSEDEKKGVPETIPCIIALPHSIPLHTCIASHPSCRVLLLLTDPFQPSCLATSPLANSRGREGGPPPGSHRLVGDSGPASHTIKDLPPPAQRAEASKGRVVVDSGEERV